MKLTTRFFLILLGIAVFPLLVSVGWNVYQYRGSIAGVFSLHRTVSSLAASNMEEWLASVNRSLAFLYTVEHPLQKKNIDETALIKEAAAVNSEIMALSFLAPDGSEIFKLQSENVKTKDHLTSLIPDLADKARQAGSIQMGEVICAGGQPFFPLAYPLINSRVVVFHFSLEKLWTRMGAMRTGESGRVIILDKKGVPLPCQGIDPRTIDSEAVRKVFRMSGKIDRMPSMTIDGERFAGAHAATDKLPWVAVSLQSHDEIYGAQRRSIILFSVFTLISAVTTVIVVLLISRRIIAPINNMVNGVKKFLKEQRLDKAIPAEGWPELKNLVGILNRMMLELQAYRAFQLKQIMEEKNKAQALIDTIPDGVLLLDNRGTLIYSNQLALTLLGLGRGPSGAVLPKSIRSDAFREKFQSLLASTEKYARDEVEAPLEGSSPPVIKNYRVLAAQFMQATLKRPGRVIIIRDITNEKELEKAKEDFFHMITHDMRAPLSTIQGYVELLMKKLPPNPGTDRYFQSMLYSSRRLRGMIDDILNTTKLQRGTMTLQLDTISAAELITRIRENHEPVAGPKKITLVSAPSPEDIQFNGDRTLIERVITNLIGNSLKFTPPGGKITLGCSQDAGKVLFWVEDTGPGIPEDKRKAIFEKYSQMEEHKSQGFGLGLAMCKMTVELHKGEIWVESELGKGSKFIFTVAKGLTQ